LQDGFDAPQLDEVLWDGHAESAEISIVGDRLRLRPTANGDTVHTADVYTAIGYDLTNCSTWLEVPTVLASTTAGEVSLLLWIDDTNGADITTSQGVIYFRFTVGDTVVKEMPRTYDPVVDRWWRIRNSGPVIYLETSPDGTSWTQGIEHDPGWDLTAAGIGVAMNIWDSAGSAPGMAEFDNVNLLPPSM
jgi:hypothetical protein